MKGNSTVRNSNHWKISIALTCLVAFAASCSSNTSDDPNISTVSSVPESTVAPSTTVPWTEGADVAAWEQFVQSYEVLDVSQVSTGECGSRAMMITEESLTMYWWDGVRWNDDSARLEGGRGQLPQKVYTHDYTNDGVLDFFVVYADEERPRTQTYGVFFAYLWGLEDVCNWGWVDINNGRTTIRVLPSPDVDVQNGKVFANGFTQRRTSARGEYEFLPSTGAFMYRELPKK
jgi:hypothetical protein